MDMNKYIGKQVVAFGAGDFGIQFAKKYNNVKLFLDNKVRYGEKNNTTRHKDNNC